MTYLKLTKYLRPIKSFRLFLKHQELYVNSLERELISLRLSNQNQR